MPSCCAAQTCCQNNEVKSDAERTVVLAGNPNCGKTTLFNALTGASQRVGNWPGVTVEKKIGYYLVNNTIIETIDLPGIYSLAFAGALDERIAGDYLLAKKANVVVNVVDACNLERHLYLTTQLIEMGAPVIVVLNMMDVARARKIKIDTAKLAQHLGCPVVTVEANSGEGVYELKRTIADYHYSASSLHIEYPETTEENADIVKAQTCYQFVDDMVEDCVEHGVNVPTSWTSRIDKIVLNRVLGLPFFLAVMYALFFFSINIGGAFQDFFDMSSQTIFVDGFAALLANIGAPTWLTALLANGIGKGINTTITFIPVIGAMFLFLAFLEDSGYMARAAFVVDRFMRALGLPGKAFVPMIVGFGCNVPSVMGARTLENKRDRILTIMMSPFMSCGARLAIFAVFTAAFFPHGGQNVIFALYMIGIGMAVLTGYILRATVLKGEPSPLVMELPLYHLPSVKTLQRHAWQRLRAFLVRAGRLIVPICVIIGALNSLNLDGSMNAGEGGAHSLLSLIGQWATVIFQPMGIHADNWPATVGLVTGILAKEVVIGTLNTLYTQVGHFVTAGAGGFDFWAGIQQAFWSIPENFAQLGNAFSNPVLATAPTDQLDQGVYGLMYQKFDGQAGAFAYLLFVLLYFPCISTTAAMLRELHRGWAVFSALWMTGVAYMAAVIFYQAATWSRHPLSSTYWVVGMAGIFIITIAMIRWSANRSQSNQIVSELSYS